MERRKERFRHVGCACETVIGIQCKALCNDFLDRGGYRNPVRRQGKIIALQFFLDQLLQCFMRKDAVAGDHFIEHGPEREYIGAMVELRAVELFGAEVDERADDFRADRVEADFARPCDPEIHELDEALFRNDDIVRFDVAMNKAVVDFSVKRVTLDVCIVQRKAREIGDRKRDRGRQPLVLPQEVFDRGPLDKFHFDEGDQAVDVPHVVDFNDVWMVDVGEYLRFGQEPFLAFLVVGFFKHLDGPDHFEPFVPDLIDIGHAPFAHQQVDPVGADLVAHLGHGQFLVGVLDLIAHP